MRAKKSLGQHFLKDKRVVQKMLDVAKVTESDTIVEIGPGKGILTEALLLRSSRVLAFEIDNGLCDELKIAFSKEINSGGLELFNKDILDLDLGDLDTEKYKVIANIPYFITGKIIRRFLEGNNKPESATYLLQKEVAQRIVARDGKESILSISVKSYGDPKYVAGVPASSFTPKPKVDSAILSIKNIDNSMFKDISKDLFFKILKLGFSHKRKKLLKNLALKYEKKKLVEVFSKLNLDENIRAEKLKVEDWKSLSIYLSRYLLD